MSLNRRSLLCFFSTLCFLIVFSITAYADFITISFPGTSRIEPYGVNNAGTVVGWSYYNAPFEDSFGFVYENGEYSTIKYPGSASSTLRDINDNGEMIGSYYDPTDRQVHGFVYDGTTFSQIKFPGAINTYPRAISNNGYIAGYYYVHGISGFIYDGENYTTVRHPDAPDDTWIKAINSNGEALVECYISNEMHYYIYDGQNFNEIVVPGADFLNVMDIDDNGNMAGVYADSTGYYGFIYDGTDLTKVQYPGSIGAGLYDISNNGNMVGIFVDENNNQFAFAYINESTPEETLENFLDTINDAITVNPDVLGPGNKINALTNKIDTVLKLIEAGDLAKAIAKLKNDILRKTNGCATKGTPDKNDWVIDCEVQAEVYPMITEVIAQLESQL